MLQATVANMKMSIRRYRGKNHRIALLTLVDNHNRNINYVLINNNLAKIVSATEAADTITRLMAQDSLEVDGQEEFVDIFRPTQSKDLGIAPAEEV